MQEHTKKTLWIEPELDFDELLNAGRYEDLIRLSDENSNLVLSLFQRSETTELKRSLNLGMVMLSYFERALKKSIELFSVFCVGKLKGYLEAMDRLQFASDSDRMVAERARLLGTKHLNEIIFALETHGSLSHSELGSLLGLQASTLSEVLKKVKKTQLVYSSPYGKYKIYSLTSEGAKYGALLRRKQQQPDMDATIDALQSYLQNQNIRGSFLKALNDRLSTTSAQIIGTGMQIIIHDCDEKTLTKFRVQDMLRQISNSKTESFSIMSVSKDFSPHNLVNNDILRNEKVSGA